MEHDLVFDPTRSMLVKYLTKTLQPPAAKSSGGLLTPRTLNCSSSEFSLATKINNSNRRGNMNLGDLPSAIFSPAKIVFISFVILMYFGKFTTCASIIGF